MPPSTKTSGIKAGCIYRIKLVNFVTYKEVELYPGLSLNMIIGPNGTGKSTFVSALILGLCGNIASIGRSKKLSEYIRSQCDEASIEIELYQERGKSTVNIKRVFNRNETSKWYINNRPGSQKNVKDLIASFGIQVDNLCQLLPQDRVKDFTKMTPQTRLQSTLAAIGQQKRVDQLENLKKKRTEQCALLNKLQKNEKRRLDLMKENEILQGRIDILNRRKEIDNEIKVCNCKKLWLEEGVLRTECRKYDDDLAAADRLVKVNTASVRPLEESMKKVKDEIKLLENEKQSLNTKINELRDQIKNSLRSVKIKNEEIKEAHSYFLEMKNRQVRQAEELEIAKANLDRLQVDLAQALEQYGDETGISSKLANLRDTIKVMETKKQAVNRQKNAIQSDFERNLFPELARCRSKIQALEDVDRKRLQTLESYNSDAHEALLWLRKNRHQFSSPVCEPMMLEIKFSDPRFSRYLESTVSRRDLTAFTFYDTDEMNAFLKKMRQEKGLRMVHAVNSPPASNSYRSPDIRAISQYGFQAYLRDTFTADDMIVRYLCRNYNVHNIPIGNDYTYNSMASIPTNIPFFFSENHRISVKVSRYSGDRSTSITEIKPPYLLADTVDVDKINEWKEKLTEHEKKGQTYQSNKQALDSKLALLEAEHSKYVTQQTAIQEHSRIIRQLRFKIRAEESAVREKSQPAVDERLEREKCARTQRDAVDKQVRLHRDLVVALGAVYENTRLLRLLVIQLKKKRNSTVEQEKQMYELKRKLTEAQEQLKKIKQLEEQARRQADAKLQAALRVSENRRPGDARFPSRDVYGRLPGDLTQLQDHCNELITKIDCMSRGDEGDLQTYERNKEQIEQLLSEESAGAKKNNELQRQMERTKVEWMEFMNRLIEDINLRFREMFAQLGFGGEVRLDQGTCEDDFGSYGVVIMVKFRAGEALQDLKPFVQSGGERSISTAIYLFALQHLTQTPFRCVDEINQGMDSLNEKKMFEFLVNVTTEKEQGQYFLLTPKLLTGLKYNENVTVHTIMNGRGAMTYDKWQMDSFIANARSYRQAS